MPWDSSTAHEHDRKANTPKKKSEWSKIANSVREKTGSDKLAVIEANGIIKKSSKKSPKFSMRKGYTDHGKAF